MIGWTREGDADHPGSGLAVVITIGDSSAMWLDVGKPHANGQYKDALGNMAGTTVTINADGWGRFLVSGWCLGLDPRVGSAWATSWKMGAVAVTKGFDVVEIKCKWPQPVGVQGIRLVRPLIFYEIINQRYQKNDACNQEDEATREC